MRTYLVLLAVAAFFAGPSAASDSVNLSGSQDTARLDYVGDDWRVGIGLSDEGDVVAELLGVLAYGERDSWVAEGWFQDGAGGLKLNYHWLPGDGDPAQQDSLPGVYKLYVAADQNRHDDRKLSLGAGYEKQDVFFSTQFSLGLTDERLVDDFTNVFDEFVFGNDASGRPFRRLQTTSVLTETFEQAYDYGAGLRVGRYFNTPNVRIQGGLDYEWGDFDASQTTVSATAEKFFTGTSHSLALSVERFEKSGDFEVVDSDTRGMLTWRYAFGRTYRPRVTATAPPASASAQPAAPQPSLTETRIVRSEVEMESDAFFALDSAEIRPEARETIQQLADLITRGKILGRVSVVGHTCDLGPEAYNQRLSNRRAESVKRALVDMGVDPEAIVTDGRGESEPAVPNTSEANRKLNRRVDVQFIRVEEKEEVVRVEPKPPVEALSVREETVRETPAWVMRALRNPAQHKRSVDVYRFERTATTVTLGEREFLNRTPLPENDTATAARNGAEVFIDVLANDTDPDGDALTVASVSQPASGTVVNNGDFVTYTPAAGFQGEESFTYTVSDGSDSATATVTVTVNNDAPVAQADTAETRSGESVQIDVLANDSDPNGDELDLVAVSGADNGTASIVGDQIRYAPNDGFTGTDSFTYTVRDAGGAEATAEVMVTVSSQAPVAAPDSAQVIIGQSVEIDVLANDSDPDGDPITLISVGAPLRGTAEIVGQRIRYTPDASGAGSDTFTYEIESDGGRATGTVSVQVEAPAPTAVDDSADTEENQPVSVEVLANDLDGFGQPLTIIDVEDPSNGTTRIEGTAVIYTPEAGFVGTDSFEYTIREQNGGTASATVTITVESANTPPVAQDDFLLTNTTDTVVVDVLANDSDPDGDPLAITDLLDLPGANIAVITVTEDNRVRFEPTGWNGRTLLIRYRISDGRGGFAEATLQIKC